MPVFFPSGRRRVYAGWPLAVLATLLLAACGGSGGSSSSGGGGGGGGSPPPSPDVAGTGGSSGSGGSALSCTIHPTRSDPLFGQQWYLDNTGQAAYSTYPGIANEDIHLCDATQTGAGVVVAVVDTGIEIAHEDLAGNILNPTGSAEPHSQNFAFGSDPLAASAVNPTNNLSTTGDHGTSVSGIIAAATNSVGGSGVANQASLVGYNLLYYRQGFYTPSDADEDEALGQATFSAGVYVFNQSWGYEVFDPISINASGFNPSAEQNYVDGTATLRGSKGAIYVKSAGNGFSTNYNPYGECYSEKVSCQNANMDPYNTIPYQIVVGAVNAKGIKSSYSTAGSALWVSAPGGEYGATAAYLGSGYIQEAYEPAMVTTDQTGLAKGYSASGQGINAFDDGDLPANANGNYTSAFNGTSSAAPVTSGVVALLLQANSNLTWRDVKHILAVTAEKIDAGFAPVTFQLGDGPYVATPGWVTNAAGRHFHEWYGFGRINAGAALAMAGTFTVNGFGGGTPYPTLVNNGWQLGSAAAIAIPDNNATGASRSGAVSTPVNFIEAVQVQLNINHTYPGDLGIELISPSGTRSVVLNFRNGYGASPNNFTNWIALSNAFYGENPNGTWTLKVVDGYPLDTGTLLSWYIRIYGH